jgi:hypothetical protein
MAAVADPVIDLVNAESPARLDPHDQARRDFEELCGRTLFTPPRSTRPKRENSTPKEEADFAEALRRSLTHLKGPDSPTKKAKHQHADPHGGQPARGSNDPIEDETEQEAKEDDYYSPTQPFPDAQGFQADQAPTNPPNNEEKKDDPIITPVPTAMSEDDEQEKKEKKDDGMNEVKKMFEMLLAGQNAAQANIEKNLKSLNIKIQTNDLHVNKRIDKVEHTMDSKLKEMEGRLEKKFEDFLQRHSQYANQDDRTSGSWRPSFARNQAQDEDFKAVVGGWQQPQLQKTLHDRARSLADEAGIKCRDIFSKKRGRAVFLTFDSLQDLRTFVGFVKRIRSTTKTAGDDHSLWCKISQSQEERAKTRLLRCAARAFYSLWEAKGESAPDSFIIDYRMQDILLGDSILLSVRDDAISWKDENITRELHCATAAEVRERAENYINASE